MQTRYACSKVIDTYDSMYRQSTVEPAHRSNFQVLQNALALVHSAFKKLKFLRVLRNASLFAMSAILKDEEFVAVEQPVIQRKGAESQRASRANFLWF